jgi:hypothetical protein
MNRDSAHAWWIAYIALTIAALFFGAGWASHAGHYPLAIVALTFAAIGLGAFSILIWLFVDL